jgi:hypothetical protein
MSGNRLGDVAVQVLVDDAWLGGWLDTGDARRRVARLRADATAPGENRWDWFQQAHIRRV